MPPVLKISCSLTCGRFKSRRTNILTDEKDMSLTVELLRLIGSPFATTGGSRSESTDLPKLHSCSEKNRMTYLFLERANLCAPSSYSSIYREADRRRQRIEDAVANVSNVLVDAEIDHAIFKTIRPYRSTTVDIDTLIFQNEDYLRSVEVMQRAGYKLVVRGPRSTTLWDQGVDIGIDLYEQVAVSFITYIDKHTLVAHASAARLPNGREFRTLAPEADLACIIAHSIMKEQMYTLSEYYTCIYYLKRIEVEAFLQLVERNNITNATRAHTAITALLHQTAHKTIPKKLQQIVEGLGEESFETARLVRGDYRTPHKYHPITTAKSLLEISKGKATRESVAVQLIHMADPTILRDFLGKITDHVRRETY